MFDSYTFWIYQTYLTCTGDIIDKHLYMSMKFHIIPMMLQMYFKNTTFHNKILPPCLIIGMDHVIINLENIAKYCTK